MYPEMDVDGREEAVDEADEPPCRVEGDGDREQDDTACDRVRSSGLRDDVQMRTTVFIRGRGAHHPDMNFFHAQLRITLENACTMNDK
jgi:hypothetical protein